MTALYLSCEHGGNAVPDAFKPYFKGAAAVLRSHRGWDIGALGLFEHLAPLAYASSGSRMSRLVIELNRSLHHPRLFSEFSQAFPAGWKQALIEDHYTPYRTAVQAALAQRIAEGAAVLHVGVHSFTPIWEGVERTADIGLLYDPARPLERSLCARWRAELLRRAPGLRVRMNAPYRGTSDGLTTTLRKVFPRRYAGVELEVNQRFAPRGRMHPDILAVVHASLRALINA